MPVKVNIGEDRLMWEKAHNFRETLWDEPEKQEISEMLLAIPTMFGNVQKFVSSNEKIVHDLRNLLSTYVDVLISENSSSEKQPKVFCSSRPYNVEETHQVPMQNTIHCVTCKRYFCPNHYREYDDWFICEDKSEIKQLLNELVDYDEDKQCFVGVNCTLCP